MIKLKKSNCDEIQKLKLWQNSNTEIGMKLKNSNGDKNKKNQFVTKLKKLKLWQKLNCDKNQIVTKHKFWQKSICD